MTNEQYPNQAFAQGVSNTLNANRPESIDLTPTWAGILPSLLAIVRNAESFEAQETGEQQLRKMADLADRYVALAKRAGGAINLDAAVTAATAPLTRRELAAARLTTTDIDGILNQ